MSQIKNIRDNYFTYYKIGIGLNILMVILFIVSYLNYDNLNRDPFGNGLFLIGYILTLIYFIAVATARKYRKKKPPKISYFGICALSLHAFSVSAYNLNLSMHVFSDFVPWADVLIVIIHVCLIYLAFIKFFSGTFRIMFAFLIGISVAFSLYQALYLSPTYFIAVVGVLFIGMPAHLLVPLFILIGFTHYYLRFARKNQLEKISFWGGVLLPVSIAVVFCLKWKGSTELIHKSQMETLLNNKNQLPQWVHFSQEWPSDWLGEKILKSSLVYDAPFGRNILSQTGNSFGEVKMHDPLVGLCLFLFGDIDINEADRIKILESQFDARHHSHRKLWRGDKLTTKDVLTNIQVYPDYRLAYTEKTITIKNHASWQRNQQEALYTFHLPEGSVVTSLSLWIEGKEEKSRLTTKGKADKAYAKIVGVERRDPALLHWQEGNRVTVTVFPCTPKEDRIFKIGVTTPLEEYNDKLILKNIYFNGPELHNSYETTLIAFESEGDLINDFPDSFKVIGKNKLQKTGEYTPYWEISCDKTELSEKPFSFNGKSYSLRHKTEALNSFEPSAVYLDINAEWTKDEIKTILEILKGKQVYVYHKDIISLDIYNKDFIEETLLKKRFSLFPLGMIKKPESSLLISKSNLASPNLADLKNSVFEKNLKSFLDQQTTKIKLFHIGNNLSPYLKTMKEFQVFQSYSGDFEELKYFLENDIFVNNQTNENEVLLGQSDVMIVSNDEASHDVTNAPDHLLRLYNYNKILKNLGSTYFKSDDYSTGELIDLANEAYVVSPISSLIVLETKKDYDRFDIDENKNSLGNAKISSSGAVPEPHEWALIILGILTISYLYLKKRGLVLFNRM